MSKVILIGGQKGGIGKSTMTSFFANFLTNMANKNLLVIDADDLQHTLARKRAAEIKEGHYTEDEAPYKLIAATSDDVSDLIDSLDDAYDIIMVDLPGNLKQSGVVDVYCKADYIFIPLKIDFQNLDSLKLFLQYYEEDIVIEKLNNNSSCIVTAFLNNVDNRNKDTRGFLNIKEEFDKMIPVMENFISRSVLFERGFNTFEAYENAVDKKKYWNFYKEVLDIIDN